MSEATDAGAGDAQLAPDEAAGISVQLEQLADLDLVEHPDVYQRIHAELQEALAGIDDA
jgi:hypothetical protein